MKNCVVLDTNILLSGLRSNQGASFQVLELLGQGKFDVAISVPLILEYEQILRRYLDPNYFSSQDISEFLDYICQIGIGTPIFYLWRPLLRDPYDDHILELAVASNSSHILTFNKKDFFEAKKFGIQAVSPRDFLTWLGGNPWAP